ncbi:hypothetical protein NM688_g4696 [Phlebia brevispora]|uniref:Uncharacterized protein n=1 Tax=Phlebia brevispora TaxID=194682 RepID=A0ACC1T1W6_9APHY|nr:hypothetical protein NM688_g4696 [Phlebia brevispora]
MPTLLRRPTRVVCFYCNTQVDPRDPRNFRCLECGCWNRYDKNGEIMSDEPAMHDEKLNVKSFAKRASPRKDRLPTVYGQTLFCRTCQTNQMLISNLLSNYLPSPSDPEYAQRVAMLPEYRESVETRYPPVCADCLPAVEEEIKKRNQMARTSALGGFLQTSRGKGKQRQDVISQEREKLERQLLAWRARGLLWVVSLMMTVATYVVVLAGYELPQPRKSLATALPVITFLSIAWTAWDPTYASLRRAQIQGREIRQRGKQRYNVDVAVAGLVVQTTNVDANSTTIILIYSAFALRLEQPPPVRLVEQPEKRPFPPQFPQVNSLPHSRNPTPAADQDILASLTLSNKPILTRSSSLPAPSPRNPIFGVPSFTSTGSSSSGTTLVNGTLSPDSSAMFVDEDEPEERDPDAMDWSPASPVKRRQQAQAVDDNVLLRPQRFFAPEEPTGLENLFAQNIKLADEADRSPHSTTHKWWARWKWKIVVLWAASVVLPAIVIIAGWRWWETRTRLRQLYTEL